jgi:hypothetical protein
VIQTAVRPSLLFLRIYTAASSRGVGHINIETGTSVLTGKSGDVTIKASDSFKEQSIGGNIFVEAGEGPIGGSLLMSSEASNRENSAQIYLSEASQKSPGSI